MNLTDAHIQKLEIIADDEVAKEALSILFLSVCDLNDLLETKTEYSNSQLGQIARSYRGAQKLLEIGFKQLKQFERGVQETPKETPAGL